MGELREIDALGSADGLVRTDDREGQRIEIAALLRVRHAVDDGVEEEEEVQDELPLHEEDEAVKAEAEMPRQGSKADAKDEAGE